MSLGADGRGGAAAQGRSQWLGRGGWGARPSAGRAEGRATQVRSAVVCVQWVSVFVSKPQLAGGRQAGQWQMKGNRSGERMGVSACMRQQEDIRLPRILPRSHHRVRARPRAPPSVWQADIVCGADAPEAHQQMQRRASGLSGELKGARRDERTDGSGRWLAAGRRAGGRAGTRAGPSWAQGRGRAGKGRRGQSQLSRCRPREDRTRINPELLQPRHSCTLLGRATTTPSQHSSS